MLRRPAAFALIVCLAPSIAAVDATFSLDAEGEAWVHQTLDAMTLGQRVGQLLMPAIPATASIASGDAEKFGRMVQDLGVGCFTLRVRSGRNAIDLVNALQASGDVPLLINANFERGTGTFWPEGTIYPRQMAIAATGDPDLARQVGAITARECRACGVHWISVPICDVNINPENPIINIRSFGEDVESVIQFSNAFIDGCQSGGVLACAKHFPGHGDTATDSHLELPVVTSDRTRLDAVEFPPFRAAVDAGVATVMTSHIFFPALMGDEGQVPATLSRRTLAGLLRDDMKFQGLVITDAMTMRGITQRWQPGEAAIAAIAAGADVILDSPDFAAVHAALVDAVRSGALSEERLNESAERILRAKAALGLQRGVHVDTDEALAALRQPDATALASDIARRAITVARDEHQILPLDPARTHRVLSLVLCDDAAWDRDDLDALTVGLRSQFSDVSGEMISSRDDLPEQRRRVITAAASSSDVTIVSAFVRTAAFRGRVGLGDDQLALIHELAASGAPMVLAVFGSPYLATAVPEVPCIVLTFDDSRPMIDALPAALAGKAPITGQLPVTLPGIADRGAGLTTPTTATSH